MSTPDLPAWCSALRLAGQRIKDYHRDHGKLHPEGLDAVRYLAAFRPICRSCNGTGRSYLERFDDCAACHGSGDQLRKRLREGDE